MIKLLKSRLEKQRFIQQSAIEFTGITFLTEGFTGSTINLSKELRLNGHPIAIMDSMNQNNGVLYNYFSSKHIPSKKLVKKYVFSRISRLPDSQINISQCEKKYSSQYNKDSLSDYMLNHRRPKTLMDLNWEDNDWVRPASYLIQKYPILEKLIFGYSLVKNQIAEYASLNANVPEYKSYDVIRATAYSQNERIGTIVTGLPGHSPDIWYARNLFEESFQSSNSTVASNWIALTSFGGTKNMSDILKIKRYLQYKA